jgi:hypothetical protein
MLKFRKDTRCAFKRRARFMVDCCANHLALFLEKQNTLIRSQYSAIKINEFKDGRDTGTITLLSL